MTWNHDIRTAPHGRYVVQQRREGVDVRVFVPERVILATKCGKVTISHYLPEEKRWMMLAKGEQPVAWQKWPEHPFNSHGSNTGELRLPENHVPAVRLDSRSGPEGSSANEGGRHAIELPESTLDTQNKVAGENFNPNDPVAATDTTGDYLRKPPAVVSGQIIREGDAPREDDHQAGEASQGGGDASSPDTVSSEAA